MYKKNKKQNETKKCLPNYLMYSKENVKDK